MEHKPLPLIILAGSDPKPAELPDSGADLHPLKGYKGMALRIRGRPLVDLLVERLLASGSFDPIYIAGPARIYGPSRQGALVIDTDRNLGENVERGVAAVTERFGHGPLALTTCDILPSVEELHSLMEDYYRHAPLNFWFPVILAPDTTQQIGASFWKPRYRIAPKAGEPPCTLLPGHLIVADTGTLRLPLVYRIFELAYRSRNRSILYRLGLIVSHVFATLLVQDLQNVMALQRPAFTFTVLHNAVALALRLRKGVITSQELAERLDRIFVMYRHRRRHPERMGRLPLLHGLSLAKDIDTEEEAREMTDRFG